MFSDDWGDRMAEPLEVVVLPFQPTSQVEGKDRTTMRQRDIGAGRLGFDSLAESDQKTSKFGIHSFPA